MLHALFIYNYGADARTGTNTAESPPKNPKRDVNRVDFDFNMDCGISCKLLILLENYKAFGISIMPIDNFYAFICRSE